MQSEAKAEGKSLSQKDAFKRALEQAFTDKVKSVKGATAAEAARQRASKAVNRPRDTSGRFASDGDRSTLVTDGEREEDAIKAVTALMKET